MQAQEVQVFDVGKVDDNIQSSTPVSKSYNAFLKIIISRHVNFFR